MNKIETKKLLEKKWRSLSSLKSFFEKENVKVLYFDGMCLETKAYRYTLISPELHMEKL